MKSTFERDNFPENLAAFINYAVSYGVVLIYIVLQIFIWIFILNDEDWMSILNDMDCCKIVTFLSFCSCNCIIKTKCTGQILKSL